MVTMIAAAMPEAGLAQDRDADVDGYETCRAIWREYGRTMSGRPRAVFCEVRDVGTFVPRGTIDVEGDDHNGLRITGAQRSDARVRLVIQTQGETVAEARELARRVTIDLNAVPLRPDVPDFRDSGWRERSRRFAAAMLVLDVPVESNVTARVRHAPLEIENVRGRIDVSAEHGPLDIRDVAGDVRARSKHGPLTVSISTPRWVGAGLDALAQHGPMTLRVPKDFNAELEIGAEHGPINVDIPLTLNRFDRSLIQTKVGAGGPRVRAIAEHGPMTLRTNR
jgi:hypothetical protein